ncbi:MAG: hypothetical protein Q4F67_09370, partial [Propionibacteriaceae bacterium]|nr:hypothetical protein [Propionibacteriaceae bacterium]
LWAETYGDQLYASFDNGEYESEYHVFASGVDTARPVGLMVFADGSGGDGFYNPRSPYQLDAGGEDGLVAVARKHNMILLTPVAPPPGCDYDGNLRRNRGDNANCWYDPDNARGKAQWSSDLLHHVKSEFDIEFDRVVVGGFSSGAQWATQFWAPAHGEEHEVDLTVAIGYGGAPVATPKFSEGYKSETAFAWDTGTADHAYRTDQYGSIGGYNWYTDHGFQTHATWPPGVDHPRPGEFHLIMDREITRVFGAPR